MFIYICFSTDLNHTLHLVYTESITWLTHRSISISICLISCDFCPNDYDGALQWGSGTERWRQSIYFSTSYECISPPSPLSVRCRLFAVNCCLISVLGVTLCLLSNTGFRPSTAERNSPKIWVCVFLRLHKVCATSVSFIVTVNKL